MPERAEIEAATDALLADSGLPRYGGHRATVERRVRIALAAADRVRDARGDDECSRGRHEWAVSGDPATTCVRCGVPWAARSPQDEVVKVEGEAMLAPSRDGKVAVEGWRVVALQLAHVLRDLHPQNPYYREKQAEALAAFDALAGESNEGGNQNDERRR